MRLVVNVPTYCEKENIEEVIKKVLAQSKNLKNVDLHVLIADSHSPDGTGDVVRAIAKTNPRVHYLDVKVRGLGVGIIKGHRYAIDKLKADILAQMDGDLSHDPSTLPIMYEQIQKGYDLVNGSRLIKGGKNLLGWHRRLFTRGSALFCKIAWGTFGLSEYTNSYRMFKKSLFEKIDFSKVPWHAKTYIIQPAFLHAAITAGAKIKEVPIIFEDRRKGYSKAQIVSYTLDVLRFGIKVRIQRSRTFVKFLIVGAISYLVSASILGLLNRGQIYSLTVSKAPLLSMVPSLEHAPRFLSIPIDRLMISSLISIEIAILLNFTFHEKWTFKSRSKEGRTAKRLLKFNITSLGSPIIQLASILFFARALDMHEQIGLAFGVAIGLFFNYLVNTIWIWKINPQSANLLNS